MRYILNPFIFIREYYNFILAYVPYKHKFFKFSKEEWEKIKKNKTNKFLIENRIFVEPSYKNKFIKKYSNIITKSQLKLGLMYMIITDYCNFKCPYCFIESNYPDNKRNKMTWDVAKKSIDYFLNNIEVKEPKIIFYGGEPTLNKEVLIKSIERIRSNSKKIYIGINTNGSIYDDDLAEIFKQNNIIVSISLDGFEKINDKTRIDSKLKGTSDLVFSNIKKYIEKGVKISFSVTINGYNLDYLPAISKYIIKSFPEVKSIGYNLSLQNLKGNKLFADPEFSSFQLYNSFRILRKYGVYEDRVLRRLKHLVEESIYLKDCGACGNQIVVLPDGSVGPCHGFSGIKKYFTTNINNLNFKEEEVFKKWNLLSPVTKKVCIDRNCPFLLICGNSCPYYSDITKGDLYAPDERMCSFLDIMIQEIGKDLLLGFPKAIVIDYDGTLISRKPSLEVIKEVAKKYNYNKEILRKDFYDIKEIFSNIAKELGKESEINNMIYLYLKKWKEGSSINSPLINQLRVIKDKYNMPIYILSNSKKENIEKELTEYNLLNFFDGIFSSEKYKKPDTRFYEDFLLEFKLQIEDLFYIGDSYVSDIKPIYKLGIRAASSFFANPDYFMELNNGWLSDIFDDLFEMSKQNGKNYKE